MRALIAATVLVIAAAGAPSVARADDALATIERQQKALYDRIAPSVVYIVAGDSIGSGFVVGVDGLVLTNKHVIGAMREVKVVLFNGEKRAGKLIEQASGDLDLVLLDIGKNTLPRLPLSDRSLEIGTWVAAIGHGMGTTWTYTTGMVSNTYPVDGFKDKPLFQTQIPLNPGNSGGPIFDRNGVVVGVVTAGIQKAQSINFAIRSSEALRRFTRLSGPRPPSAANAPGASAAPGSAAALTVIAPADAPVFIDGAAVGKGPRVTAAVSPGEHEVLAIINGAAVRQRVTFPATLSVELKAP